jgi:hypothetical protein
LTEAVTRWSYTLWRAQARYYIDLHRKPVYSDQFLPHGLIGRGGKILGSRTIGLLHDDQGHPLLALTNLIMWARDKLFPSKYAQATWKRLAPFL